MICPCTYRGLIAESFPFQDDVLLNTEKKGLRARAQPDVEALLI